METNIQDKSTLDRPSLMSFLSITSYLQAYYNHRKAQDPGFSYENWALELDFRSRSSLRMMAYGKRNVSEKLLASFARKEKFSDREQQYLVLLGKLQNTTNISLKKLFLDRISELSDFSIKKTEIQDAFDFLATPEMYITQMLISFEDFRATMTNLKQILSMDTARVQAILNKLQSFGLIESHESEASAEKIWKSKAKFFSVTDDLQKPARDVFHTQSLKEASKVIQQDILDKKLKSLFFSLGEGDYQDFVETIEQFTNKLKVKYANDYIQHKKIYKMNLQVYPVTEKCE